MIIFINRATSHNNCNTVNEDTTFLKPCGEYESRRSLVSYLPCSASCEPSSFSLRLWAPQSSSRTSRRFLLTCSQSTCSSRFGPSSSASSVSVTKCCTIDLETLSPVFLFQPNEAILSWKGRKGCYSKIEFTWTFIKKNANELQCCITSFRSDAAAKRVKISCMLTSRLATELVLHDTKLIAAHVFPHTSIHTWIFSNCISIW